MRSGVLEPVFRAVDERHGRLDHRSAELTVLTVDSVRAPELVGSLADDLGADNVRYYLSGGAGPYTRPVWAFCQRQPADGNPTELLIALGLLQCREEREAAADRELRAVRAWFADADHTPRVLVLETLGEPGRDDIAFWQACRLRLARHTGGRQAIVVVRHAPATIGSLDDRATEILLALRLAGDHVAEPELERWRQCRGWDAGLVAELTSTRRTGHGVVCTYATAAVRSCAERLHAAAPQPLVRELAALVVAGQATPSLATAALLDNPAAVLAAFSVQACAEAAGRERGLTRYAGNLYRRARARGWAEVAPPTAAVAYLCAIAAERRRVPVDTAHTLLRRAEEHAVGPEARGVLAYGLGQLLVKDPAAAARTAGLGMFDYVRRCRQETDGADPETRGSQIAASFNGAALAHYRDGDLEVAVDAMRAGLDELRRPGVLDQGHLDDQQVLLLTNLAKVHRRSAATRASALAGYREAWQVAVAAGALPGVAYVAADLVRMLVEDGQRAEAESVAGELIRRYDAAHETARSIEKAVVAVCWHLADLHLSAGSATEAAAWYLLAARRMRRGGPGVLDAVTRNLRELAVPAGLLADLERERAAQTVLADDLAALRACLKEGAA